MQTLAQAWRPRKTWVGFSNWISSLDSCAGTHVFVCGGQELITEFFSLILRGRFYKNHSLWIRCSLASQLNQGILLICSSRVELEVSYLTSVIYVEFEHPNSGPLAWATSPLTTEQSPQPSLLFMNYGYCQLSLPVSDFCFIVGSCMYTSSSQVLTFTETSLFPENQAGRALTRSFTLSFRSEEIGLASSVTIVTDMQIKDSWVLQDPLVSSQAFSSFLTCSSEMFHGAQNGHNRYTPLNNILIFCHLYLFLSFYNEIYRSQKNVHSSVEWVDLTLLHKASSLFVPLLSVSLKFSQK